MRRYIIVLIMLLSACTHTAKQLATPICDTLHATYVKDIKPALKNNCYACHAASVTATGGLDLEDTASLKSYLQYDYHGDGVYGSKFYHIIQHTPGSLQMPPTYIMDSCTMAQFRVWLKAGAPL